MEKYIFLAIIIGVLLYWFRERFENFRLKFLIIGLYSLFAGILVASAMLFILTSLNISSSSLYGAIIGPFFEEVAKFITVVLIMSSLDFDNKSNKNLWGLGIGILIGLGFGIYENYLYFRGWSGNMIVLLFRTILIGGIMLHPLTSGIYGYMLGTLKSQGYSYLEKIFFEDDNQKFKNIKEFLIHSYKSITQSSSRLWDFIKNALTLDITINYIFGDNKPNHNHSKMELVVESFFLGFWIHSIYNTIIIYINYKDIIDNPISIGTIQAIGIIMAICLKNLFEKIFGSKIFGYLIMIIMITGFVHKSELANKIAIFNLVIICVSLIIISWKLDQKLNAY